MFIHDKKKDFAEVSENFDADAENNFVELSK